MKLSHVLALIWLPVVSACSRGLASPAPPSEPVRSVKLAQVAREARAAPVRAWGRLEPRDSVALAFKVGGVIRAFDVDEGDVIRPGQRLATLDQTEIDAQVRQAETMYSKAERDLARAKTLNEGGVATKAQLEDAQSGFQLAQDQMVVARFNQRHAAIVAPGPGRVQKRLARVGELVGPGMPVLMVGNAGRGWVARLGVSDRDLVRLSVGDRATLEASAFPGVVMNATVSQIAAAPSPTSGVYEVELRLGELPPRSITGVIVAADITPKPTEVYSIVPIEAILEGDRGRASVFVVQEGEPKRAKRIPVEVAFIDESYAAVRGGLDGVSQVITDGAGFLTDGSRVTPVH